MPKHTLKPQVARAAQRRAAIWSLHLQGFRASEIASKQVCSYTTVKAAIKSYLHQLSILPQPEIEKLRRIESERLDLLLSHLMDRVLVGEVDAIRAAVTLSERRSKLLGLDMPAELRQVIEVRTELTSRLVAALRDESEVVRRRVLEHMLRPLDSTNAWPLAIAAE